MKRALIAAVIAFTAFSTNASTGNGNNPAGSTQLGPMANCTLPTGEVKYIPVGMCRNLGGQY